MNTSNSTISIFPDSWEDLWKLDRPLDFEAFLKSDLLSEKRNEMKTLTIILRITGSISVIASTCLNCHILRSYDRLSTTYHRLVFCLSTIDILTSFCYVLSPTMVPKELNYLVPYAQGNTATCEAQGFIIYVGYQIGPLYNCAICFYYLAIVRYNKKDEYIRNKLEPWFHGLSIILPLAIGFILLTMKGYNENGNLAPMCFTDRTYPPHCIGYESGDKPQGFKIPCGRGDGGNNPMPIFITRTSGFFITLVISPIVIIVTMLLMYRSVSKIEKIMQKYGVNALRLRNRPEPNHNIVNDDRIMDRIKTMLKCTIPGLYRNRPASKSNSVKSQKRAVLNMAAGYAFAWCFVFVPYIISVLDYSYATRILFCCLNPLQGFFTFCAFMSPKVRNAKRSKRETLTWRQAFIKTWMSRGVRKRTTGGNVAARRRNSTGTPSTNRKPLRRFLSRRSAKSGINMNSNTSNTGTGTNRKTLRRFLSRRSTSCPNMNLNTSASIAQSHREDSAGKLPPHNDIDKLNSGEKCTIEIELPLDRIEEGQET
jgi:hypothetical protein